MGKVLDFIAKLKNEAPKQDAKILDIVADNETLLVDLNTSQLMEGRDSDNAQLKEYQSESYARMKASLNPRRVTDLNLSGDFHKSFVAITDRWPVLFSASDSKTDKLVTKYGENIFGLNDKSLNILSKDYLKNSILEYYRTGVFHV